MPRPAETTAAELPRARKCASGEVELYGALWDGGLPRIAVELSCYRLGRGKDKGGLGAEAHFRNSFHLMWPKYEWNEWVDLMVWAWCNYKYIAVIGHERASKTYTFAHLAYLDYCADPTSTLISLSTVTFEGLKFRMWSDLLTAHETASCKYPFLVRSSTNEMRLFPAEAAHGAEEKFQIHGMAISRTKDAEGRIRGGHAPRRRIILDEAQDVADTVYEAAVNPMSAPDAKMVLLSNPVERISRFGDECEPKEGWGSVSDGDLVWETRKGVCLHFDGLQSPNIKVAGANFTGLLTAKTVEEVKREHGENSVSWWKLIRGFWPPDGMVSHIFPASVIDKMMKVIVFDFPPVACASLDPAFEYDEAVMHLGELGGRRGGQLAVNGTRTCVMQYNVSKGSEPKDYQLAHWVMRECRAVNMKPEHFIMDTTGGGRGTFAILQKEWSPLIQGVDYAGAASERPLRTDQPGKCHEMFRWFVTELGFRARACGEDGMIGGLVNLDRRTQDDLHARRYEVVEATKGSLRMAENKKDVRARIGRSPDCGDSLVQFGELLIRLKSWPGAGSLPPKATTSQLWSRHRERAKKACQVETLDAMYPA
jgi:hypothetical protein